MPRLTITITDDQEEFLEEITQDDGEYESKSEAVRNFIDDGERIQELEQKVERLEHEKQQLIDDRQEHQELVRYVEDELTYREKPLSTRLKWFIFGKQ